MNLNQSTAALRRLLLKNFPGVDFCVRQARGSARGWVSVGYTDGPSREAVRALCAGFETQGFDGMTDQTYTVEPKVEGSAILQVQVCQAFSAGSKGAIVADLRSRWDGLDGRFDCAAYSILRGLDEEYACTFHGLTKL